tara:strand:+ start:6899 stop:8089 length:1191 start_codon:yes stop_codon:yes gene_type:complete
MSSNNNDNKNNKRKNKNPEKKNNKRINLPIIIEMGSNFNSFIEKIPNDYHFSPVLPLEKNWEPYENEEDYPSNGKYEFLDLDINNINDLITLGQDFKNGKYDPYNRYNLNLFKVARLVNPLIELKNMIGMENIKKEIFDIIMYQLQEFDNKKDMLHTIVDGEPGVGKTELTKIIAKIYKSMGYLENEIIKFVKRSDLIGGYLGQTAIKTQKVLKECKGGILIIDEAYSLGNPEGRDSYSKECIDTLTAYLSETPETIVFIIGYKEALDKCFFSVNRGLERRFTYRFSLNKYEPNELKDILFKIVEKNDWKIEKKKIKDDFFIKNKNYFIFNGGDMLNLFTKSKFSHSKRFFKDKLGIRYKKKISYIDLEEGFKMLLNDTKFSDRNKKDTKQYFMYT